MRYSYISRSSYNKGARFFIMLLKPGSYVLFNAIHFHWRHKVAIREDGKAVFIARNSCKFFDIAIPWIKIFIAYRPVDAYPLFSIFFKVYIGPPIGLSSP